MTNIDALIKNATEAGLDEPLESKSVRAEKIVLEVLNSKPERIFRTRELNTILWDNGIRTTSSTVLRRMIKEEKCKQVAYGIYRANQQSIPPKSFMKKIKLIMQKIF